VKGLTAPAARAAQLPGMEQRREAGERARREVALRLVGGAGRPRVRIDPRDGFPWRGLAAGLCVWLALAALCAAF
jgi:hypothetical protein